MYNPKLYTAGIALCRIRCHVGQFLGLSGSLGPSQSSLAGSTVSLRGEPLLLKILSCVKGSLLSFFEPSGVLCNSMCSPETPAEESMDAIFRWCRLCRDEEAHGKLHKKGSKEAKDTFFARGWGVIKASKGQWSNCIRPPLLRVTLTLQIQIFAVYALI